MLVKSTPESRNQDDVNRDSREESKRDYNLEERNDEENEQKVSGNLPVRVVVRKSSFPSSEKINRIMKVRNSKMMTENKNEESVSEMRDQVLISQTFYEEVFDMKVFCPAFLYFYLHLFVFFRRKKIIENELIKFM